MRRAAGIRIGLTTLGLLAIAGCGSANYEEANLEVAAVLTAHADLLDVNGVTSQTYCRSDGCLFGDDAMVTEIDFTLTNSNTPEELTSGLRQRLPGWTITLIDCAPSLSDCNGIGAIFLEDGNQSLYVDLLTDTSGVILADIES